MKRRKRDEVENYWVKQIEESEKFRNDKGLGVIEYYSYFDGLHEKIGIAIEDNDISEVQRLYLENPFNNRTHSITYYIEVSEFKIDNNHNIFIFIFKFCFRTFSFSGCFNACNKLKSL